MVTAEQEGSQHFEGFLIDVSESVRQQRELEAVGRISAALAAQTDVASLIDLAGGMLQDNFASDLTYVALYDPETDLISFPFLSDAGSRLSQPALRLGEGPTATVLRRREPVLLRGEAEFDSIGERRTGRRAAPYLGVPILSGEQAIGVLGVQALENEHGFDDADARLLAAIAASVGSAIRNADLLREQRESERRYRQLVEAIPIAMYRAPEGEQNSSEAT